MDILKTKMEYETELMNANLIALKASLDKISNQLESISNGKFVISFPQSMDSLSLEDRIKDVVIGDVLQHVKKKVKKK